MLDTNCDLVLFRVFTECMVPTDVVKSAPVSLWSVAENKSQTLYCNIYVLLCGVQWWHCEMGGTTAGFTLVFWNLSPHGLLALCALPSFPAGLTATPAEPAQLRYPRVTQEQHLCLFLPEKYNTFIVQFIKEHTRKDVKVERIRSLICCL